MRADTTEQRVKVLTQFDRIQVWKRGDQRAPNKPLLILFALARVAAGKERLLHYREVDSPLDDLLEEFGPPRRTRHPEYPFWHLCSDGVWEIPSAIHLARRKGKSNSNPPRKVLLEADAVGGFVPNIQAALERDRGLLNEVASQQLSKSFPVSLHRAILDAVGLSLDVPQRGARARDPKFREDVLRAYQGRCCVCGYDLRLGNSLVALDAAHIKWVEANGPDTVDNGLALCSLHHRLLDQGVFTISKSDSNYRLLISENIRGTASVLTEQLKFHGRNVQLPQRTVYYPKQEFLQWHAHEVFRHPARET